MLKASKQSVDYSRGHAGVHCGKVLDDDKAPGFDELKNKVELPGAILRWAVAKLAAAADARKGSVSPSAIAVDLSAEVYPSDAR